MNKRAVTVGLFIFIALAIFIAGVLALGGQNNTFTKTIAIRAVFDDVSGLQQGNNVWLSGVKVGIVKKISFVDQSKVEVIMNIERKEQQYIRKDAKAKIGSEGLIGNKIIVLYGGTPQAPAIEAGTQLAVETATSMDEMMSTLQENNKNLLAITSDFKQVSSGIASGQGTIGKLLKDETIGNDIEAALRTLKSTSVKADALTSNLANYTSKLQSKGSLTNDLITDTVIFSKLRSTVNQIEQVSRSANEIIADLNNTSQQLKSTNTPIGILLNDRETAADLKLTLRNLQSGTEKLDENMEALQHNFLLRGFFRKKAKAEAKE